MKIRLIRLLVAASLVSGFNAGFGASAALAYCTSNRCDMWCEWGLTWEGWFIRRVLNCKAFPRA
jgi:hypothetical protein